MDDQHRQELLRSSAAYATAKLSFANAIVIAQRAGETDEEIAHVTGYTVPMIRALRSSWGRLRERPRRSPGAPVTVRAHPRGDGPGVHLGVKQCLYRRLTRGE